MRKYLVTILALALCLCGCGVTFENATGGLSGEYVLEDSAMQSAEGGWIYDRVILFPDGTCYGRTVSETNAYSLALNYSYSSDTSYILIYSGAGSAYSLGLAKMDNDRLVFERMGDEQVSFSLKKVEQ